MCVSSNYEEGSIERGCPLGSVLGHALWNLVLDELRVGDVLKNEQFLYIAFVDDLTSRWHPTAEKGSKERSRRAMHQPDVSRRR